MPATHWRSWFMRLTKAPSLRKRRHGEGIFRHIAQPLSLEPLEDRDLLSLVTITGARDLIYDGTRQFLFVTTSTGRVERYDVANQTLLSPFQAGTSFNGADITPNGKFLYAAESAGATKVIRKVDLTTGVSTSIPTGMIVTPTDVVITNNGKALINGEAATPYRQINLVNDAVSTPANALGINIFDRSPDGSRILGRTSGISSGAISTYSSATDTFAALQTTQVFNRGPGAVNRNGTLFAYDMDTRAVIFDANLKAVESIAGVDAGLAFSPTQDLLVVANSNLNVLIGYDTNTWAEKFRIDAEEDIPVYSQPGGGPAGIGVGTMTFSSDGARLFLITTSGVRQYVLPQSSGVANRLTIDAVSTFVNQEIPTSVTVTLRDPAGNVASGFRGQVQFAMPSDPSATLPATYTFDAADSGTHTFDITLQTIGTHSLTVSVPGEPSLTATVVGIQVHAPNAAASLPVTNCRDLIFDSVRNRLYMTTDNGRIERYDVATQSLLAPWIVTTGALSGGDLSLDGDYLFVSKDERNAVQAIVYKIHLTTGEITRLSYASFAAGSWDVAIAADGIALLVGNGTIGTTIHTLDTATGLQGPDGMSTDDKSSIVRSADRSRVFIGGVRYDAATHTFGPRVNGSFPVSAASRDGALFAYAGTVIRDGVDSTLIHQTIPRRGGLIFDPVRDVLFIAEESTGDIHTYDTNTWAELTTYVVGAPLGMAVQYGNGTMAIASDYSRLFVRTPTGIRHFDLTDAPPTPGSAGGPYVINEGAGLTLNATAGADPDVDQTLSYSWDLNGDGVFGDASGLTPTLTAAQMNSLGLRDGPQTRTLRVRVSDGTIAVEAAPTTLTINNVAPSYTLSGAATIADNATYTLNFGMKTDPGMDTITSYRLDWGDGTIEDFTGTPAGSKTHSYVTGGQSYTIVLSVTDEDGTYSSVGTKTVMVNAIPPTVLAISPFGVTPGNTTTKDFRVTFSEVVVGLDVSDFVISTTGQITGVVVSVGSGIGQYVVSVNGITGNGTIGINVINDGTIKDLANLTLVGGFTGAKITVDQTPPNFNLTGKPDSPAGSTAVFTFSRSDPTVGGVSSGMHRVEYSLDGAAFAVANSSPLTINNLADGSHTISFRASDMAGNVTPLTTHTWTVYTGPAPIIVSIAPFSGPTTGGTTVIITGTNFDGATAVIFGMNAAASFTVNSSSQITATAPAGSGTVDITVTTPAGTSATSEADRFSYKAPPTLLTTVLNGGTPELLNLPAPFTNQRSMVRSFQLTFDSPVTLTASAVSLSIHPNPLVTDPTLPGTVSVRNSTGGTGLDVIWNVTFADVGGGPLIGGSLVNGEYDLNVDPNQVSDAFNQHLAAAPPTLTFYRLLGDADGNRTVNNSDIIYVRRESGKTQASPNYLWLFDTDWNGTVNNLDIIGFRRGLGRTI